MDKLYIKARGKVNLTLNVLDKREDGYHDLESVFQIINLYDEMYIEKTNSCSLELICNIENLENGNNIISKAYALLRKKHSEIKGIKVTLIKNIPNESGIGGGSADCANFLIAMNKLFNLNYTKHDLIDIGKTLGADVPPCLHTNALFATRNWRKNRKNKYFFKILSRYYKT